MEKSMRGAVEPGQERYGAPMLAVASGLSLFWACLLSVLVRNTLPCFEGAAEGFSQQSLLLRVALFLGFAVAAFLMSRAPQGRLDAKGTIAAACLACLYSVDTVAMIALTAVGVVRPLAINLLAWAVLGAGLASLVFLWLPLLCRLRAQALAPCLALAACSGGAIYLLFDLLPATESALLLASLPLISLALRMRLADDARAEYLAGPNCAAADRDAAAAEKTLLPWRMEPPIPFEQSRKNAQLSWAFGIVNIIYGVVFGLAAATVTQWNQDDWIPVGVAAFTVVGALCAYLLMSRTQGRVRQSTVMRFLFPVMVVALAPQALMQGLVPVLCNLLLIGCYIFLTLVSVGFEVRGAQERGAAPLFFVGMSQTSFAGGLAAGFALGILPGITGGLNQAVLSGISLGLVVLLAIIVTTTQNPMANAQDAAEAAIADAEEAAERAEFGHWKMRCAAVAEQAGLSNRETEVFMLLAKGRGTEHIQNKLGISSHTVKTHTYNIYHKMGINSREELLDAVEEADPAQAAGAE